MQTVIKSAPTDTAKLYLSGPIEQAKQILRREVMSGLCVTIEPTLFIYTGGEESGYVVGLLNYPRFPSAPDAIWTRALELAEVLMRETYQHSALVVTPDESTWITCRVDGSVVSK